MDVPALGAAEEPLLVSNCLALADSQWLSRRASASGRGDVRRLAPLVRLNRGTKLRRTRWGAKAGRRAPAGQCGMYRVLGPRPEMLFLVEFQYESLDDEDKHLHCDWGRLTSVNLAGRCIKVLGELPLLPCVSHLDLSYNQLASLGSLYAFPNLRSLNLAFNNFVTLVNMRSLPALESLNLSWNNIRNLLVVLKSLNKHAAALRCLQVCHNPVEDVLVGAHGRHLAARYLPRLAALDGEPVHLDASRNTLETLPMACLQLCPGLQRVDLSRNYLRAFPLLSGRPMHHLVFLDLSCNQLSSLCGVEEMTVLRELYLANNHIGALQDLQPLRKLQRLCVLDLTGNAVSEDANFKKFVVFHLRSLECVNGQEVVDGDLVAARETFGGCLDRDALLTQYTWRDLTHLVELHLPGASLRQVDLPGTLLPNLEVLDLSHNGLCCLWGLQHLPRLAMLDLGHNQVRSLRGPERPGCSGDCDADDGEVFPSLHTLYLDHNGLTSLQSLGLGSATRLRTLFLQHNQLDSVADLGHGDLRGLVLDGNHLDGAALLEAGRAGLLLHVRDLHLDGNHVHGPRGLDFLARTGSLARLFVAKNKLAEPADLEPLRQVPRLRELCLLGNPVCLRPRHFAHVRELLPDLAVLDGHPLGHPLDPQRYLCTAAPASPSLQPLATSPFAVTPVLPVPPVPVG
ncbi:leucine-rich repeat-containing protein 9-like [Thrips palmi]|uniref:Leucine-rich repeat-containing protein 9-like n=1 Tax=Thrips palmi TaxID=161013 RepID=A0A6P8Z824_THRPL|nr:leucine-rich repeat-containing protein 9-like [Thrips palmi]